MNPQIQSLMLRNEVEYMWMFPTVGGTPKSSKSLDHSSIETDGDLRDPLFF